MNFFFLVYSYNAQNPDELTIVENEQLEVIGDGDGDGWLRARNYRGEEGYVPHNYLDVERDITTDTNANQGLFLHILLFYCQKSVKNLVKIICGFCICYKYFARKTRNLLEPKFHFLLEMKEKIV